MAILFIVGVIGALALFHVPSFVASAVLGAMAFFMALRAIPAFSPLFIKANLYGIDLNKASNEKIPEAAGVVCAGVYLVMMFLFIPFPFFINNNINEFEPSKFNEFLAALLSVCCMIFLGFADDVLDLRWRHKLVLPTVASLPLLMVYMVNIGSTSIVVPIPLQAWFGTIIDVGILYYVYMGMLAVFCTNAINILAGINGVEVGQSVVIAISILVHNIIQYWMQINVAHNVFSIYLLAPFIGVSLALLRWNWYPSKVFVGDTFCYFAGMTFAVVGILGHFSKTMMLFFIPQILNFLYSIPQLFKLIPCPRHRLPRIDHDSGLLNMSRTTFKMESLSGPGRLVIKILKLFCLVDIQKGKDGMLEMNNLTIINFFLKLVGPLREDQLCMLVLTFQVLCSGFAFFIRYIAVKLAYDVIN